MPHDPALVDVVDGVRCAVHFVDGEFGRWRVDFDEEAGEAITGWLGPPDKSSASGKRCLLASTRPPVRFG
jgi:hypothetical protein